MQQARVETEPVRGGNGRGTTGDGHLKDKAIGELVRDLSRDTATLFRQESQLLKTEMNARVGRVERNVSVLGVGASIAWFGCMALTAALILGLAEVMPGWIAALIVGAAYVGIGAIALAMGRRRLAEQRMRPEQTTRSVRADIRAVREAAR